MATQTSMLHIRVDDDGFVGVGRGAFVLAPGGS